jgi:hypothetical protein
MIRLSRTNDAHRPRGASLATCIVALAAIEMLAAPLVPSVAHAAATSRTGCPREMARIGDSCVDRWEASLVELVFGGGEIPWSPFIPPNGHRVRAVSRPGVVPQGHVSYPEAKAACRNAGKRLCSAREWERACKGPAQTKFPYGDEHVAGLCVDAGRTTPNTALYPMSKAFSYEGMNDPRLNQLPNTLEKTGAAAACTNELGVFDMVGNLHEWAADARFHGGYYLDVKRNGQGCEYVTSSHASQYYDYSLGFRCCADASSLPEDAEGDAQVESFTSSASSTELGPASSAWEDEGDGGLLSRAVAIEDDVRSFASRLAALWTRARAPQRAR